MSQKTAKRRPRNLHLTLIALLVVVVLVGIYIVSIVPRSTLPHG